MKIDCKKRGIIESEDCFKCFNLKLEQETEKYNSRVLCKKENAKDLK